MKRSLERSLQLEQRTKRWSRGCPPGAGTQRQAAGVWDTRGKQQDVGDKFVPEGLHFT